MRSLDAVIAWTPNRDPFKWLPTKGEVAVTIVPELKGFEAHPISVGACDLNWRRATDSRRRELMQRYLTRMIYRDGLRPEDVLAAISVVEDFRAVTFSTAKPDPEDKSWLWGLDWDF
jgi:hypothetical protein